MINVIATFKAYYYVKLQAFFNGKELFVQLAFNSFFNDAALKYFNLFSLSAIKLHTTKMTVLYFIF